MSPAGGFATEAHLERFLQCCKQTVGAAAMEAGLRQRNRILGLDLYIVLRRFGSGLFPCFVVMESLLRISLPEALYTNLVFTQLYNIANDLVWWANVSTASLNYKN